ncbi:MAG: sigma-70 family RNA polymerase sigma factor [Vicinamibacterales bacterium]
MNDERGHRHFATTRWSVVLAAGAAPSSARGREALAALCDAYWYPLYGFLRSRGQAAADAEDLTQAFFARMLTTQAIGLADPARGRFRSYLLSCLRHFVANEHARTTARKRGGGVLIQPLEFESAEGRFQSEPASDDTPERAFDRRWAFTLLGRAMDRLRADAVQNGRPDQFAALKGYLTGDEPRLTYAQTAAALGVSEGSVKVAVHRLRARFRDIVRDEIAETVGSSAEIEHELRHLWSAVGR